MFFENEKCSKFSSKLKEWRISHLVFNRGYHIQIQREHNFYPSTNIYYNPNTGKKFRFSMFKNVTELNTFLSKNVSKDD